MNVIKKKSQIKIFFYVYWGRTILDIGIGKDFRPQSEYTPVLAGWQTWQNIL